MKKVLCAVLSLTLAAGVLSACGKKATQGGDVQDNAVQSGTVTKAPDATPNTAESIPSQFKATGSNITESADGGVEVAVEEREGEERYTFDTEDLGFVDTTTGAIIKIGMTVDEVESLIGAPIRVDSSSARIYSGIVVLYDDNGTVEQLIVGAGNMNEGDDPGRFVTPRGVQLYTTLEQFKAVYGDEYNAPAEPAEGDTSIKSTATMAVRYYAKDGDNFTYLGESYTNENKPENDKDLITQTFLFSTESNQVSVMSIKSGTQVN